MSLDGTFNDLSLPSLIQLQCSERRRAQVRLTRADRTAELVFADGELIHASVTALAEGARSATLTGDPAVFELLSWDEADFHVSDGLVALPVRTVNTPAHALLLEGLRQLDEQRAERSTTLEQALKNLRGQQGLRRALIVNSSGRVRADATEGSGSEDAELIALVTERAQAIGAALNYGAFQQLVCTLPSEKTLIEKMDEAFLAAWVDAHTPLDVAGSATLLDLLKALLRSFT